MRRFALLAPLLLAIGPAFAADYEPPIVLDDAPEYVPVEVGSGWYLRGDVAYNFAVDYENTDFDANLDVDDLPLFSLGESIGYSEDHLPVFASIGAGFHFTDYLRGDLNVGLIGREEFETAGSLFGDCVGVETISVTEFDAGGVEVNSTETSAASLRDCAAGVSVTNERWVGMANAYLDLGTYSGLTPYVGAGAGLLYTRSEVRGDAICGAESVLVTEDLDGGGSRETEIEFLCDGQDQASDGAVTYSLDESSRNYDLMYGLSAGFGYQLAANTTLDVGYQYLSAPGAKYYTIEEDGLTTNEGIDFHQVKVGLRYDLW